MKTPAEVLESLNLTGSDREQVSQRLSAIRTWLETAEGHSYVAALPVVPAHWDDDSFEEAAPLNSARDYHSVLAATY